MVSESSGQDAKNAAGNSRTRRADMNVDEICTFKRGEEEFNGIISIETDLYYALGGVSFAASSILRYYMETALQPDPTPATFQNKHQVRLALKSTFPFCFSASPGSFSPDTTLGLVKDSICPRRVFIM